MSVIIRIWPAAENAMLQGIRAGIRRCSSLFVNCSSVIGGVFKGAANAPSLAQRKNLFFFYCLNNAVFGQLILGKNSLPPDVRF